MWMECITFIILVTCPTVLGLATDVRLAPGIEADLKPYEGIVEVEVNGTWGPIARHAIDDITVKTICRMLGYGYIGFLVQRFQYPGTPLLNKLKCYGNETSIAECIQDPVYYETEFEDSPGIHCFDHVFTDIRITGGTSPNSGSVQVKMDGRWGRVCDYNSACDVKIASEIDRVICRTLGYEMNDPRPQRGDGNNVTQLSWIDLDTTTCNGSETNFNQCKFLPVTMYQPDCYATRVVTCITNLNGTCTSDDICAAIPYAVCRQNKCVCKTNFEQTNDGKCAPHAGIATNVRLARQDFTDELKLKSYEGLVEVEVNGTWGPILRHGIDDVTAKTICKILGNGNVGFLIQRYQYTGKPLLNKLKCFGNESSIAECIQEPSDFRTEFNDSPGIHCFNHVFTDVRITGGSSPNSGIIQVKMDGRWGRVCDYNSIFGVMAAPEIDSVICRTVGYEMSDPVPLRGDGGNSTQLSWIDLDMTVCNGSETNFNQCKFRPVTIYQPGCYATRAVTCITNLNGTCTSDDICAAVPYAVCRHNTCVCKKNFEQTNEGKCAPRPGLATNVRLTHGHETGLKPYEGIVEVEINGTWGPLLRHAIDDVTIKTICRMLGYGPSSVTGGTSPNIPNAVCRRNKFVCKDNYRSTNSGKCVPQNSH